MAPSQKEIHYLAKREGSILKYYNCKTTLHSYPLETILEITEGPPNQKKLHYEAKKKGSNTRNTKYTKSTKVPRMSKSAKKEKILEELLYLTKFSTKISQRNEYLLNKLALLDTKTSSKKQLLF